MPRKKHPLTKRRKHYQQKSKTGTLKFRIEAKIKALQQEKSALGFFKVKEKKVIQEQINNLASDNLEKAKASREAAVLPIQAQIDAATVRIAEIDEELTKER